MEVDSVVIIAILSMSYITTRIVKTDKSGKNFQSVCRKPNYHTRCGVKIAIKFSPCTLLLPTQKFPSMLCSPPSLRKNNKPNPKHANKPKLRTNPESEQIQKFPSMLRSPRSLRKNNRSNPKNTKKPKFRKNPEFGKTQKF